MNVGKIFENEIRKLLERENLLVIHQTDIVGKRFTIKKEFDFAVCDPNGFFCAVEAKATRTGVFQFSNIKKHQRENLTAVNQATYSKSFLALNLREKRGPGEAYLIPWGWWANFEKVWSKKSVRRSEAAGTFWRWELRRIIGGWEVPNVTGPKITTFKF